MLWALALLAPCAVLACDLPRGAAWPLALAASAVGGARAWHWSQRAACLLVLAGGGRASVDGVAVRGLRVAWRGPLAFITWRGGDGRRHHLDFWPDTLPAALRRELRLLPAVAPPAPGAPGMAH